MQDSGCKAVQPRRMTERARGMVARLGAVAVAVVVSTTQIAAAPWSLPEQQTFVPPAVCTTDPAGAGKATRPGHATYRVCEDQMSIFRKGLADARAQGKLLLVVFGASWCPWCATLQKHLAGPELLGPGASRDIDLREALLPIEIALSTLDKGQKADVTSGEQVLALLLAKAPDVKMRMIPFIAVVDPRDDTRVLARNLDDVANRSGDFNVARARDLLVEAHATVRGRKPAAAEPGWLHRQWLRLWN